MGKSCCVGSCSLKSIGTTDNSESVSMHMFPNKNKDFTRWNQWRSFVSNTRKDFEPSAHSYICQCHFTADQYHNKNEFDMQRKLNPKA